MSERPTLRLRPGYTYDAAGRVVPINRGRRVVEQVSADDILAIIAWNEKAAEEQTPGAPKRKRGRPVGYRMASPRKGHKRREPTEDSAPAHIKRLRARYCEQFIKTGHLDETMGAELRAYANSLNGGKPDGRERHARTATRISAEHETDSEGQGPCDAREQRGGDHVPLVEQAD